MSDAGPFAVYLDKWLAHEPELRLARGLLRGAFDPARVALHCLEHELVEAALADSTAAGQAKLAWWLDECARAQPRHPVLRALDPADAQTRTAAIEAARGADALATLEAVADVRALVAAFAAVVAPLARERARRAALAPPAAAALDALAAARVVAELREWQRFAAPAHARVPLTLLARHALDRVRAAQLRDDEGARDALRSLAAELAPLLDSPDVPALDALDAARVLAARAGVRALARDPRAGQAGPGVLALLRLVLGFWRVARRDAARRLP